MNIAVASTRPGPDGRVPDTFSQTAWLLIYNEETGELVHKAARDKEDGDMGLAREIIKWDCEGVLCGPIEREPFLVIAEACITRYYAVGLNVEKALEAMRSRSLDYIRDHIGGDHRPPQGEAGACGGGHHHH